MAYVGESSLYLEKSAWAHEAQTHSTDPGAQTRDSKNQMLLNET